MEVATSGNEYIDTVTQILSRMLAEIKEKDFQNMEDK